MGRPPSPAHVGDISVHLLVAPECAPKAGEFLEVTVNRTQDVSYVPTDPAVFDPPVDPINDPIPQGAVAGRG